MGEASAAAEVPSQPKPPRDFFKSIFEAGSSDEDDEDDEEEDDGDGGDGGDKEDGGREVQDEVEARSQDRAPHGVQPSTAVPFSAASLGELLFAPPGGGSSARDGGGAHSGGKDGKGGAATLGALFGSSTSAPISANLTDKANPFALPPQPLTEMQPSVGQPSSSSGRSLAPAEDRKHHKKGKHKKGKHKKEKKKKKEKEKRKSSKKRKRAESSSSSSSDGSAEGR